MDEIKMQPQYLIDSYQKEFETKVKSVKDEKFVALDNTIFYPNGGGQPYDTGKIVRLSDNKEFKVVYTGKFGGEISHEVEGTGLSEGDNVLCKLDWDRRYKLMRSHTASHIISGVIANETGAKITGNQIEPDKIRIDFSLENFDREKLSEYVQKSNEIIDKNLNIKSYEMRREEVEANPEMVKLAAGLPPGIKTLRIVEIEGFDRQPDGGTHVKSTKEVGHLELLKCDNKGKNNRRIYFKLND